MQRNPIISRMLEETETANVSRLAAKLGVKPQTIQPYKQAETVPDSWLSTLRDSLGINPEYLKTGRGPKRLGTQMGSSNPEGLDRKFETMIFHANGQDRVLSDHQAAGLVTNASGEQLPIGHMIEHILCPEVRSKLDSEGAMVLTGSGLALPLHRLQRWGVDLIGARSLQTGDGLVVFDVTQTEEQTGAAYIVEHQGYLAVMRFELDAAGAAFASLSGTGHPILVRQGVGGQTPRIIGKAVWIGKELF
jgi:hypothetical protein